MEIASMRWPLHPRFHQSDDNFLRDAEKLLSSEIALVMELSQEEARNYLREQLQSG